MNYSNTRKWPDAAKASDAGYRLYLPESGIFEA